MSTNTEIMTRHGITDLALEYPELEVPVLSGAQAQGDVSVWPVSAVPVGEPDLTPIGRDGVTVVRAETDSANTHSLHGNGGWAFHTSTGDGDVLLGHLSVPAGGQAHLIHTEEHSVLGIGPGLYAVHGKREQGELVRRVAD